MCIFEKRKHLECLLKIYEILKDLPKQIVLRRLNIVFKDTHTPIVASLVAQTVSVCSARDLDLIPGSGRSPGEGNGNPFQYSCLENPMDGEAW